MVHDRTLVVIPTYNEAANLEAIVQRVLDAVPEADVLVVDDNSPDGTGDLAGRLAAGHPRVHALHRTAKDGLGQAYLAGFAWGLREGYAVLLQMDADGSHLPEEIPTLVDALVDPATQPDLVIGSRWVPGGSVENWPRSRELLSRGGNAYARLAIGIGVRDATGGFRAWRRTTLETIDLADVASHGYCFQVDLARRAVRTGLRVVEVPIRFVERVEGESKMSSAIVREAMWRVTVWGAADRLRQARHVASRTIAMTPVPSRLRRRLRRWAH